MISIQLSISDTSQLPAGDETAGVIVDVELEEADIDDHHDSQMISQLISEGEDDDIDHTRSKFRPTHEIMVVAPDECKISIIFLSIS